jgi:hypothetical protein
MERLRSGFLVAVILLCPALAQAQDGWWGWLEQLSGPGPFHSDIPTIEVRFQCFPRDVQIRSEIVHKLQIIENSRIEIVGNNGLPKLTSQLPMPRTLLTRSEERVDAGQTQPPSNDLLPLAQAAKQAADLVRLIPEKEPDPDKAAEHIRQRSRALQQVSQQLQQQVLQLRVLSNQLPQNSALVRTIDEVSRLVEQDAQQIEFQTQALLRLKNPCVPEADENQEPLPSKGRTRALFADTTQAAGFVVAVRVQYLRTSSNRPRFEDTPDDKRPINLVTVDPGVMFRVHPAVDVGAGLAVLHFGGEGVDLWRFGYTPAKVSFAPFWFAGYDGPLQAYTRVLRLWADYTYIFQGFNGSDFGNAKTQFMTHGEYRLRYGMVFDITALLALLPH